MSDTVIIEIPIEDLHDSPTNPRTIYVDTDTQELADNIRSTGRVLQPLQVRPRTTALFGNMPDSHVGYEIVFGHRRRRAAELAGLTTVPCMVRAMTDTEVKVAQVSENLQRKDVHPIEEAQGFQLLLDEGRQTADDLVTQFGKSRTYVYGRLKLLQACAEVRKACLAGEIGAEAALLVARVGNEQVQQKALAAIRALYRQGMSGRSHLTNGGKSSHRIIRDLLQEKFTLRLNTAIFNIEDESLLPTAMNCVMCPKRAGNAPVFSDITKTEDRSEHTYDHKARADVCTDPDCFAAKKKAHLSREAAALTTQGKTVVEGNKARAAIDAYGRVKGDYVELKSLPGGRSVLKAAASKVNRAAPIVVTIQDPRSGKTVDAIKRSDLIAIGLEKNAIPKEKGKSQSDYDKERRDRDAKAATESELREATLDEVRDAIARSPRNIEDLRAVAAWMIAKCPWRSEKLLCDLWRCNEAGDLVDEVKTMAPDDIARLMLDLVIVERVHVDGYELMNNEEPEALNRAAVRYGVDVAQVRAAAGEPGQPTPSTAALARKDARVEGSTGSFKPPAPNKAKKLPTWPFPSPPPAGYAGCKTVDAGSAGDHDGQAQLELDTEAGQEVELSVDAGFAGEQVDQVNAAAEVA